MRLFTNLEFKSLEDLFVKQLEDLYDAETRLVDAIPKMVQAASTPELKRALEDHWAQTQQHVQRLDAIFQQLGREPESETCEAMKGLINEGEEVVSAHGDADVKDAAIIAAAQRVEHYEMAGYGTVRTFARRLGFEKLAGLLQTTLEEEAAADRKLTQIAERQVNIRAVS